MTKPVSSHVSRVVVIVLLVAIGAGVAGAQTPTVSVDELADGVYLFTYNVHRSLFVVTDEGVLATDPQSPEAAARYVEEIRKITAAPIKYLVYSHHHADHVSGGDVFPAETEVIAHRAAVPFVDADEGIRSVDIAIAEDAAVTMDGLLISLVYPGPSETDTSLIIFVPERSVAFMVDAVSVRTVPWRNMAGSDPYAWKAAVEHLATLDFDILAPGHGPVGTKEHVAEYVEYLDDLINAVQQRIDRGESLEQIQRSLELPQYADWTRYDEHFELNIEGVYRSLTGRSA